MRCPVEKVVVDVESDRAPPDRERCKAEALGRASGLRKDRFIKDLICVSAIVNQLNSALVQAC